jgi:hypothetical protein
MLILLLCHSQSYPLCSNAPLCTRYRHLMATGKNAHQVVVAIARELRAFMWAIAKHMAVTPKA